MAPIEYARYRTLREVPKRVRHTFSAFSGEILCDLCDFKVLLYADISFSNSTAHTAPSGVSSCLK
jgi:hypothetical protein